MGDNGEERVLRLQSPNRGALPLIYPWSEQEVCDVTASIVGYKAIGEEARYSVLPERFWLHCPVMIYYAEIAKSKKGRQPR
jgi:hypothetical protein